MACEQVEVVGVPYVSFVANKIKNAKGETANYSCCAVRYWLGQVWQEFDRALAQLAAQLADDLDVLFWLRGAQIN